MNDQLENKTVQLLYETKLNRPGIPVRWRSEGGFLANLH